MSFLKSVLSILGALDPTGIIDLIRPKNISDKTGLAEDIVLKVINAIKEDPAMVQAKMDHAEVMARLSSENLSGLDTDASFSFKKGLLGSPRRFGVTILSSVMAFLGLVAGTKAIFLTTAIQDAAGFADILKMLGGTLALLAGAYGMKYFSKNGNN